MSSGILESALYPCTTKGCARGISGGLGRSAANPFQPIPIDGYVHLVNLLSVGSVMFPVTGLFYVSNLPGKSTGGILFHIVFPYRLFKTFRNFLHTLEDKKA